MEPAPQSPGAPFARAALLLLGFVLLQWLTPMARVPVAWLPLLNVFSTLLFLGIPLAFVYQAARVRLSGKETVLLLLCFFVVFVGAGLFFRQVKGPIAGVLHGVGQGALLATAGSAGMLVARAVKEPNMLVPIAPVLAMVDIATVLSPVGIAKQVIEKAPEVFEKVAVKVPSVGSAMPLAFMGPADVLFLAMFFAVLHRAGFHAKTTLLWLIPTLVGYMLFVLLLGGVSVGGFRLNGLPALVPIAAVILIVNRGCFTLSPSEKRMTWALIGITALVTAALLILPGRSAQ